MKAQTKEKKTQTATVKATSTSKKAATAATTKGHRANTARLAAWYQNEVIKRLQDKFHYANIMMVPKITKITLNMGVGEAVADKKIINNATSDMAKIAGQKPMVTTARKSIAGFKIRLGWPIGCKVTLRAERMYEFLDRLISIALPRVRDFRGLDPRSFDGRGNYSFGIKEQLVFPEIDYDKTDAIRGLDVVITTTARTDEEARELLLGFNFPLREIK